MFRPALAAVSALSNSPHTSIPCLLTRSYSKASSAAPKVDGEASPTKRWLAAQKNRRETLPRNVMSLEFGPSSIHAKKYGNTNTKVTLQIPLHALSKELPLEMVEDIKSLKSYKRRKDVLEVYSDESRKQKEDVEVCYRKLDDLLREVATNGIAREVAKATEKKVILTRKDVIPGFSEIEWRKMSGHQRRNYLHQRSLDQQKAKKAATVEAQRRKDEAKKEQSRSLDPSCR